MIILAYTPRIILILLRTRWQFWTIRIRIKWRRPSLSKYHFRRCHQSRSWWISRRNVKEIVPLRRIKVLMRRSPKKEYPVVPFITDAPLYQPAEEIWNTEDPPLKRSKTSMDATEVTPPSWPPHIVVEFLYSYPIPFVNNLEVCADLFRHE